MEPDRWQRLTELFHQALDRNPPERSVFLDQVSAQDPSMGEELASLLRYHDKADQLLDIPAELRPDGPPPESEDPLVGRSLEQYSVTRRLGEGGMGTVYLADDTRLGRSVALKVLTPRLPQDERRRERLRREARAAAALSHPAIATIYALEEVGDTLFIVSEYVPGRTLRDELDDGPLSPATLIDTGVDIARALHAAHTRGIVHRDLKPDNVIRNAEGGIKVLDFGLAHMVETAGGGAEPAGRLTEDGAVLGTPGYMPPEQLRGRPADFRADIFACGVTLFELASGVHPYAGTTPVSVIAKVLESTPPDLTQLCPECPSGLARVITRCLQKEPEQRFDSAASLLAALEALRRSPSTAHAGEYAPRDEPAPPSTASDRGSPLWWWQFHQAGISLGYVAMLLPLWIARLWGPPPWGVWLFFASLVAVGGAATLRLHLWFTSRFYPAELPAQRTRSLWWIATGDWSFVAALVLAGMWSMEAHARFAALFLAVAVASLVGFTVVEPATTRAAFGAGASPRPRSETAGRPRA